MSSYRFVVYAPNGRRKGFLVEPSQWSASIPMNDVGALTLSYSPTAPHSDWLHDAVEVSIEAVNPASGKWGEVRSGRYILLEEKADTAKGTADMPSYTLVGYGTLLDKVTGVPAQYAGGRGVYVEGKRHYVNATVGQIMVGFLQEARAVVDGLQPGIELGFTAEKDSRGKPWSTVLDLDYEPSVSMLTALQNLAAQGMCDWWFEGRTLMAVNPDSASVRTQIRLHPDVSSEAPIQATRAGLLHTVFLQGEAGVTWRVDNEGALAPWGKTMSVLTQGGVSREATARRLIQAELDAGSRVRTERTFSANVETLDWTPLVGVTAGDWIHIKTSEGFEAVRVFQVTLRGNGSTVTVGLTLNDRFEDAQVRTAKRLKGITGGASGDAGTSTLPNPSSVKIKPAAVEGLLAESEGYWKGAQALSLVRASFAAVNSDVHGNPVMIDHYEVTVAGRTVSSKDTVDIVVDGLAPAHEVAVTAVAVSSDGHKSAPTSVKVTTVYPDARLDPPTRLAVTVNTGIVSACWDGKLQADGGAPYTPPAHFDHIRVEESSDQRSWMAVDSMDDISMLDRQDMLGVTLFYRAIAVDRIGNESDPSPISSIVVVNLLGEKIQEALDEAAAAQQRADAAFLLADAATTTSEVQTLIRTAANGLNKITYSTAVPSGSGTRSGDTWFRINTANQIIGQWQWTGSAWQVSPITNSVIASLDAGKISSGVINAARIGADSITADKIAAGAVTAAEIATNAVTAGKIAADAVTAEKITVNQALINKLAVSSLWAGKITTQMLTAGDSYAGSVSVSQAGIKIKGSSRGSVTLTSAGLTAKASDGSTTVRIDQNGNASFKGSIAAGTTISAPVITGGTISGSTIIGGTLKTATRGRRLETTSYGTSFYDADGILTTTVDSDGVRFWTDGKKVGQIAENRLTNNDRARGLSFGLEYENGHYMAFSHKKSADAADFSMDLIVDPWGYANGNGTKTAPGIKFNLPIYCGGDPSSNYWQRLQFCLKTFNGYDYPALMSINARTGIAFGTNELYLIKNNTYYSLTDIVGG